MGSRKTTSHALARDPFELERLAEELEAREAGAPGSGADVSSSREFPQLLPLSHENTYFASATFSVEEFLLSRSYTSLPDLRAELRDYFSELKEELVKLINNDYEAFISLSTDLKGEGVRLERLKWPLDGLRKDILESRGQLLVIQDAVKLKLERRSSLREEKILLHLLLKISDSVSRLESLLLITSPSQDSTSPSNTTGLGTPLKMSITDIESREDRTKGNRAKHLLRVAAEYTQLLYHTEKARVDNCAFVPGIQWRIDRIKSTLSSDLDHLFSTTLLSLTFETKGKNGRDKLSEADKAKLMFDLTECLRTYDMLSLWRDAEDVLRRDVIREFVKKTIFLGALSLPQSPIVPRTPFPQNSRPHQTSPAAAPPLTPYTPYTAFTSKQNPFFIAQNSIEGNSVPNGYLLDDLDNPLAELYNKILKFVERDLKGVLESAERVGVKRAPESTAAGSISIVGPRSLVKAIAGPTSLVSEDIEKGNDMESEDGFDIMANVVWAEIGRAIMDELGSVVFAAGRPEEFQRNYETTQAFLRSLEYIAPSLHAVQHMRSHPVYAAFEKRWQLPVYFQLRWKEIVGRLEEALEETTLEPASMGNIGGQQNDNPFTAKQSASVFKAITSCWSAEVYIPDLGYRFWRLTLQILSRYKAWLHASLPSADPSGRFAVIAGVEKSPGTPSPASRASTPVPYQETQTAERTVNDDALLRQCSAAIQDITQMERKVTSLWKEEIHHLLPGLTSSEANDDVAGVLHSSLSSLLDLVPLLSSQIVAVLIRRSCDALSPVKSIPGQYRAMSNKHMPKGSSQFVPMILQPVKAFFGIGVSGGEGAALKADFATNITCEVFDAVVNRYVQHINAMKKTGESLRRLKKGKKSGFSLFGSSHTSGDDDTRDEERVRAQLVLDVEAFGKDAESLGVDVHHNATYKTLNYIVHATTSDGESL